MTTPMLRRARAARTALAAAVLVALAAPVAAEPMQLVDVFDETDLAGGLDQTESLRLVDGNRVAALVQTPERLSGEGPQLNLLLLSRDPATGGLTLLDRVERIGERGDPGYRRLHGPGLAVTGNTLHVMGQASPTTCAAAPCSSDVGVLAYTITNGGTLSFAYQVALPGLTIGDLIASPDGRFLYKAGQQTLTTLRVQELGNLVETGRTRYGDPAETRDPRHHSIVPSPDGRFLFVSLRDDPSLVVLRTDPETGVPAFVQRVDADAAIPLYDRATMAVSPDGATLYVASRDTDSDRNDASVLTFAIREDGRLDYRGADTSANRTAPGTSQRPQAIALSADARQLLVHDYDRVIHKYTANEPGDAFVYRGFETNEEDGVPAGTIDAIALPDTESFRITDDAGFVHYANRVGGIATFDNRADLAVGFDGTATASADGEAATSRLTLFNGGPATGHGIGIEIVSDTPILSTSLPEACTIDGTTAHCAIDRLRANVPLDLTVTAGLDATGANALEATATAIELDPDRADNAARVSVAAAEGGSRLVGTTSGPGVPVGVEASGNGASAGDGDGGGGCSIAGPKRNDPMFALLLAVAAASVALRRRPRRTVIR